MNLLREIRVPQETVNDESVTVIRVSYAHGSRVMAGDVVIELETSKLNLSLEAEVDGFVYYACKEGDEVRINELLVVIADTFAEGYSIAAPQHPASPQASTPPREPEKFTGQTAFSAAALKLLEEHGVSRSAFAGHDLVTSADVLALVQPGPKPKLEIESNAPARPVNLDESTVTRKKIPKSKKREIDYLRQVQQAGLNSMVNIEVDTNGILAATAQHSKYFKHSFLPVIIYEASRLLNKFPQLNAFYLDQEIVFYNDVNVGVAIDIDDGLKTVCIRNSGSLGMRELEDQLFLLSNRYVDRKLTPSDLSDITFTITDLSGEGIHFFSPLINQQNAAILGIAAPKASGQMVLTLTFDHRVTEGKTASRFLKELKDRVECYKNQLGANAPALRCSRCLKHLGEDISGFGFLKVVNKKGEDVYLCQTCFKGL